MSSWNGKIQAYGTEMLATSKVKTFRKQNLVSIDMGQVLL